MPRFSKKPLEVQAQRVLRSHLSRSGLWQGIPRQEYVHLLATAAQAMQVVHLQDITPAMVGEYLIRKATVVDCTYLSKLSYVLSVILDWRAGVPSTKCEGVAVLCPYCSSKATLQDSGSVEGREGGLTLYVCDRYPVCDAYVGVHKGDNWPLGSLANAELRKWRNQAHLTLERLRRYRAMSREEAYTLMRKALANRDKRLSGTVAPNLGPGVGGLDINQCKQVVAICSELRKQYPPGDREPEPAGNAYG